MIPSFLFFLGMPGARVNTLVFLLDPRRNAPKPLKPAK